LDKNLRADISAYVTPPMKKTSVVLVSSAELLMLIPEFPKAKKK